MRSGGQHYLSQLNVALQFPQAALAKSSFAVMPVLGWVAKYKPLSAFQVFAQA
jgi:hypothetical protein